MEQIVDVPVPTCTEFYLDFFVGAGGRAKVPYFGHFARSDVYGLDGSHQLVWAVEAVGDTCHQMAVSFF